MSVKLDLRLFSPIYIWLVGALEHVLFFHILGMSQSQLTNSYFSEGLKSPSSLSMDLFKGKFTGTPHDLHGKIYGFL
jgi:hypothetical protein